MPYLFGYGSLLSLASANITLSRSLSQADLQWATLLGYTRTWSAGFDVIIQSDDGTKEITALFLDLTPRLHQECNGILIEVSESDLLRLDVRETGYQRIAVTVDQCGRLERAWTYIFPAESKTRSGVVLQGYLDILNSALSNFSDTFVKTFWNSTEPLSANIVDGIYKFKDSDQNRMTGRC